MISSTASTHARGRPEGAFDSGITVTHRGDRPSAHGEGGADLAPTSEPEPTYVGGDATASARDAGIEHHHHDSRTSKNLAADCSPAALSRPTAAPAARQRPELCSCRTRNRTCTYTFGADSGSAGPETAHAPTHLEQTLVRPDQKPMHLEQTLVRPDQSLVPPPCLAARLRPPSAHGRRHKRPASTPPTALRLARATTALSAALSAALTLTATLAATLAAAVAAELSTGAVRPLLPPLLPPSISPRPVKASDAGCARAVHVHVCRVCTCISSLTNSTLTTPQRTYRANIPSVARVRPLTTFPQALTLLQRRRNALVSAAAPRPCTLSPSTPTHAGDPKLPSVAASGSGSTFGGRGRTPATAATVSPPLAEAARAR